MLEMSIKQLIKIIFLLLLLNYKLPAQQVPQFVPYGYQTTAKVARVIDGDTFVTVDSTHIRLLGVDTPELSSTDSINHKYAYSAKHLLDSLINKRTIKLTFESNTRDFFGRTLAYVWLTDKQGNDSLFIQAEILKRGYARIRYYPKGKRYYEIFYNLRRTAMKNNLGIWSR